MIKTLLLLFPIIFATGPKLEEQKVYFLLNQVESSGLVFYRNGSSYSPKEAKSHLKFKYHRARGLFFSTKHISAREFISKIASKSSTTGKDYLVGPINGKNIPLGIWLGNKLKIYGKKAEEKAPLSP